jgi:D-alanine-D-alanine ligase
MAKTKKLRVGVLMGGLSEEHEVSLASGQNVLENLDKEKYEPISIKISKDRKWFLNNKLSTEEKALKSCEFIFNALHGTFGEDGQVQALMEYRGVRYSGSGICGSALAIDKLRSREIFKLAGLQVPKTLKIRKGENYQAVLNLFVTKVTNFPVVVKPCSNGSSLGVEIVGDRPKLEKAIKTAFKIENKILIEEYVQGREFTCGVLENFNQPFAALPVTEIIPKKGNQFFNYKAKYKNGQSDEITPAGIDESTTKRIQDIAVKAHQLLGCRAYSRTDMIIANMKQEQLEFGRDMNNYNNIFVLETNTLPGLTPASLMPKAASVAGLTFTQLLDKIIESSLR